MKHFPRYLLFSLVLIKLILIKTSAAALVLFLSPQEVCRPPLVSFGVHREELPDGWLHSTEGW